MASLHMTPKIAYEIMGLEVPGYIGDDIALVNPALAPVETVIAVEEVDEGIPPLDSVDDVTEFNIPDGGFFGTSKTKTEKELLHLKAISRWQEFLEEETKLETTMSRKYGQWIRGEKKLTLELFDNSTKSMKLFYVPKQNLDFTVIFPPIGQSQERLKSKVRPSYTQALEKTYEFTLQDIGIPVFEIDDERVIDFFEKREKVFVNGTPQTLRKNLLKTLTSGVSEGESIQQLRLRIAQVFDVSASAPKTLQIARTETANFMNGERDVMFGAQGIVKELWVTAGDEVVRANHVIFGEAGILDRSFNYLDLVGGGGSLRYPGDVEGPPGETINCRCIKIPADE